ncbi:MAG: sulfotransferase [Ramlibacter sp.]
MSTPRGICVISVPKSGTMFLSRYLEKRTGIAVVFGLDAVGPPGLRRQLQPGWNEEIRGVRAACSPELEVMTRRFALMLARNRSQAQRRHDAPAIVSDHGFSSFLRFLVDPRVEDIQPPQEVCAWAAARDLAPVFLHRDLRDVASSLAHFLASGKSFLVTIRSLEDAADLVARLYAPVLAAQMRLWKQEARALGVLCVSYEDLMAQPARCIQEICGRGGLPCEAQGLAAAPENYRSWTYRARRSDWANAFSSRQQSALRELAVMS